MLAVEPLQVAVPGTHTTHPWIGEHAAVHVSRSAHSPFRHSCRKEPTHCRVPFEHGGPASSSGPSSPLLEPDGPHAAASARRQPVTRDLMLDDIFSAPCC